MTVRQLFPSAADSPDLPGLYAYPDPGSGPWLRANMVSSADGAAALEGVTKALSSDTDRHVFALLRTLCDVIVVGASTAREEHYQPARPRELWRHLREGRTPTPPIAVVSRRLDLDPGSPLIATAPPQARTIVITCATSPAGRRAELAARADVIVAGEDDVDLAAAVSALAGRGHRRVLAGGRVRPGRESSGATCARAGPRPRQSRWSAGALTWIRAAPSSRPLRRRPARS